VKNETLKIGYTLPFDRHDWFIKRGDGREVRYVIDFYNGQPDDKKENEEKVNIHLDVKPALDSFQAIIDRLSRIVL